MKTNRLWTFLVLILFSVLSVAQTPADNVNVFGYGASATGGGAATPTLVSNLSQLKSALASKPTNKVIVITQDITVDGVIQVKDGSNLTILGLPGVRLISTNWNAPLADGSRITGIFEFTRINNLIIRNLIFEGPGSYDCDGRDHITLDAVTNAWIDHCDFSDAVDDCMDIKKLSDNITISWCKFHYDKPYHPNGPGDASGDKDHRFVSLLGSSGTDKPSDGTYNVTYAYLWFGEGCMQRMVRCRNALLHFLGCYWNSSKASYYIGPENVSAYIELCTFDGGPKATNIYKSYNSTKNPVKFVNTVSKNGLPAEYGSVSAPSYNAGLTKYASAAEAKSAVTNEDCGAGATLDIQVSGSTVTIRSGCSTPKTQYTITFDKNTGSGTMIAQQGYEGANTALNPCTFAAPSGKAFAGWNTAANGSGTAYADQGTIVLTANVTLYAQWATAYTVTYNLNGQPSATPAPAPLTVGSGSKLSEPVAPSVLGQVFGGWYRDQACTNAWNFETMTVTVNTTLYAKWTEKLCDEQVWYNYAGDVPEGAAQATCFTFGVVPTGTSSGEFTMDIDGTEYHATKRSSDWNSTIQFTVPAGQTGVFYLHAKSSGSTRAVTISNGGGTLSVAGSTLATYKSGTLSAGTYTVSTPGNLHIAMVALQLCGGGSPAPVTKYTVTYNANGYGIAPDSEAVVENGRATEPAAPTANGYTFGGWYKEDGCTNPWNFSTDLVTEDVMLYAKWTAVVDGKFTVSFNMNSHGSAPADQSVTNGAKASKPADPTTAGWNFEGWYDNAECEGVEWDFAVDVVTANMTLYAKWTENLTTTWSLTGDVEGEFTKNAGESAGTVAYLTLHMNANTTYDINLYNGANTFTSATMITASTNGIAFSQGAAVVPLKTTVAGNYEFRLDFTNASAPSLNVTYPASFTATFNNNGHGTAPANQTLAAGSLLHEPVALTADGYIFGGWYTEEGCRNAWNFSTMTLTANVTLYAKWTATGSGSSQCWNISDGEFNSLKTIETTRTINGLTIAAKSGAAVTVDASSKSCDGKNFTHRLKLGGTGASDSRHLSFAVTGACSIDIYAISSSSSANRSLTVRAGSFNGSEVGTAAAPGTAVTKTTINYTGSAATLYVYSPSSGVNIYDICVNYGAAPTTFSITYNMNGHGTAIPVAAAQTALPNPLPTPTEAGWIFGGWYLNSALTMAATPGASLNANTTLYAKWTQQQAVGGYTIQYNMNGHGSNIADVTNATSLPNPLPTPSASGWNFGGWYTNSGLTSAATAGAAISQNTMLYAKWTEVAVTPIIPSSDTEGGWFEACWMEFNPTSASAKFVGYISNNSGATWTKLDEELVRVYSASRARVDALGLAAGTYMLKVVPVVDDVEDCGHAIVSGPLSVINHDRTGFAHTGAYKTTGIGAYNNDGTLKDGARVLYVSAATAKTVQMNMITTSKGPETLCTGLQGIVYAYEKGFETRPLAIRILGTITATDMDYFGSTAEGLQIKGKGYTTTNLTLEGVGKDAAIHGFGILARGVSSVEFRNFAIMDCMDDCLGLDTKNSHVWIHNIDFYYGKAGSAADQAKGDGTVDLKGDSKWVTISYNHFYDSGKMSLCGMKSETGPNYITYHHNWFDHSDSRHPRIRTMSVHIYNNYYDGNAKYGVGVTMGASAFVESNYFRACMKPMLSSMQGTDAVGEGTFSSENGGIIKACNNYFATEVRYITYQQNSTSFDAYEVANRTDKVPSNVVTVAGGTSYDNFDTEYAEMYSVTPDDPQTIPTKVTGQYGAGRLQHGDLQFTFSVSDDASYAVNTSLKSQVVGYTGLTTTKAGKNDATACGVVPGFNVMAQVDAACTGWGSLDKSLVSGVTEGTSISKSGNVLTVGTTTVTATATTATAEYTYAFDAWKWTPTGATVTANTTATATFTRTPKSYTLTWDANSGNALTGNYTTGSTAFGTAIVQPNTPTRTGYVFTGWSPTPAATMPAANTTYTAQWRAEGAATTYTITYNTNGGSAVAQATEQTHLPDPLPTTTKDGYTFDGWFTNSTLDVPAVAGAAIGANTTLYAKWTQNAGGAGTYTATIAASPAGYGSVDCSSISSIASGTAITKSGNRVMIGTTTVTATAASETTEYTYAFSSWTVSPAGETVTGATTITANFVRQAKSYTLTWEANGGELTGEYTSGPTPFGATITAPIPVRDSYIFRGWKLNNAGEVVDPAATMPAAATSYTAQWEKDCDCLEIMVR